MSFEFCDECDNTAMCALLGKCRKKMNEDKEVLSLTVNGLTLDEIKALLRRVREFERGDPGRAIFCFLGGTEKKSKEELVKIMQEIFPHTGLAG
jgi:hypothetical protein